MLGSKIDGLTLNQMSTGSSISVWLRAKSSETYDKLTDTGRRTGGTTAIRHIETSARHTSMKRLLTKFTTAQLVPLIWVSVLSLSFLLPANSSDRSEFDPVKTHIEQLLQSAQESRNTGEYAKAEASLDQAIELNQPFTAEGPGGLMENQLVSLLAAVYGSQNKWFEAERLYETKGSGFGVPSAVDETVAYYLMKQGKYAEARVVLRPFVAHMQPPPERNFCHVPMGRYIRLKEMLATCESKTENLTEEQLNQIERKRRLEINQLQNGK